MLSLNILQKLRLERKHNLPARLSHCVAPNPK